MPHITLEHTSNLHCSISMQSVFFAIHRVLHETGGIDLQNCKSRCYVADAFHIGDGNSENAFVHLDVRFMQGRSEEIKQRIGNEINQLLLESFQSASNPAQIQITVEIRDILLPDYFKYPAGSLTRQ